MKPEDTDIRECKVVWNRTDALAYVRNITKFSTANENNEPFFF
jgi:hypothetical protein